MTIVQLDANETLKWSEYSQGKSLYTPLFLLLSLTFSFHKSDWGAVSLGSIDLILVAVAISPSALSKTSG